MSANISMSFLKTSMVYWFWTDHIHTHLSHDTLYSKSTPLRNAILRQRSLFRLTCMNPHVDFLFFYKKMHKSHVVFVKVTLDIYEVYFLSSII